MIIISLETNRSALGPGGLFATQDVGQTFAWLLKNTLYYEDNLQSVWISNSSRTDCTSKFNPRANHLLFSQQSSELFLKLTSFKKSSEKTLGYQETKKKREIITEFSDIS